MTAVLVLLLVCTSAAWPQGLRSPTRIAEGAPGQLLVSDYAAQAIFVIDKQSLQTIWTIPIKGKPMGVARLGPFMFVGNQQTQSVEIYEIDDAKRKAKLRSTPNSGSFKRPTDIAIDAELGRVFVLDLDDQLVKVLDASGNLVNTFSPAVIGQPVSFVAALAVDVVRKEILITDHGNPVTALGARILIFSYDGQYQRQINGDGYVNGTGTVSTLQFARPQGLAADATAHVFMVDPVLGKMFVFDQNNILDSDNVALVKQLGDLQSCTDLVLDTNSGDIFAVNNKLGTVVALRGEGRIQ